MDVREVSMMQFKNNESELLILWFNNIKGVGFKTKQYLFMNFGSIENVYEASEASIQSVLDKMPRKRSITINKNLDRIKRLKNLLEEKGKYARQEQNSQRCDYSARRPRQNYLG